MQIRAAILGVCIIGAVAISLLAAETLLSTNVAWAAEKAGCITDKCHAGMLAPKFVHGPVAVQDCLLCHKQTAQHSFTLAEAGAKLCYLCHEKMGPGHGKDCITCHDPHGSDLEFQLKPGKGAGKGKR